jgi:predicted phosphodiesterase
MRTLIHLSDLHFGRIDPTIVMPLLEFIRAAKPDLVAISGDLTQRARITEFQSAHRFLDAIPFPQIVVPGNHDVPLHNLFSRFLRKLDRYKCFISGNLEPFYCDSEVAVSNVNTARALTRKNGRINRQQLEEIRARFSNVPATNVKIIVTHHPFDLPQGAEPRTCGGSCSARDGDFCGIPRGSFSGGTFPRRRYRAYDRALPDRKLLSTDRFFRHKHVNGPSAASRIKSMQAIA